MFYDLSEWPAGVAVAPTDLSLNQLANLGAAIGKLHGAGRGAPGPSVRFDWLSPRQSSIQRLAWDPTPRGRDPWQQPDSLRAFYSELERNHLVIDDQLAAVRDLALAALDALDRMGAASPHGVTLTHGLLTPSRVNFGAADVVAILDPDTLALRPPSGDLAALCAEFGQWDTRRCGAVLAGYRQHQVLPSEAIRGLPRLAVLRTLGALRERLRLVGETPSGIEPGAGAGAAIPVAVDQLRTLIALDVVAFENL
jgi:Ser/Thr protein kinase RdoA (MazF antagonist)